MFARSHAETRLIEVGGLVSEVLTLCQGELETHGITLRNDMPDGLPLIMGASVQLQQVILNLVTNAVEAMSVTKDRNRCLTIAARRDRRTNLVITVEDTGSGIDPAHLDHVFEPLFTTKSKGMGLGLAICRSIVEAHGGTLIASSNQPFGTAFNLTLPLPKASS